jgi:hypothetical protein
MACQHARPRPVYGSNRRRPGSEPVPGHPLLLQSPCHIRRRLQSMSWVVRFPSVKLRVIFPFLDFTHGSWWTTFLPPKRLHPERPSASIAERRFFFCLPEGARSSARQPHDSHLTWTVHCRQSAFSSSLTNWESVRWRRPSYRRINGSIGDWPLHHNSFQRPGDRRWPRPAEPPTGNPGGQPGHLGKGRGIRGDSVE